MQEYGLLSEEAGAVRARISGVATEDYAPLAEGCDFVVETVSENLELKRKISSNSTASALRLSSAPTQVVAPSLPSPRGVRPLSA